MNRVKLLGINIDYVTIHQASEIVENWLKKRGKHYIVTPNPEMIVDSGFDPDFKKALNAADLSFPDSSRLGWATTTRGIDFMENLIRLSEEKAYTTAYLGGTKKVADKLYECLRAKYPKLKIEFCSGNIKINQNGETDFDIGKAKLILSKDIKRYSGINPHELTKKVDILFVAFGHIKQEKWMNKNLPKLNARVMMGVGGAFDYLSGEVPRAPKILRVLGFEWLFRLIVQPWRIKRYWKLPYFVYKVITKA